MKKRFSEEQIVVTPRDGESGQKTVEQLCREHGVSQPTYYGWKRKYGSMAEPDVKRLPADIRRAVLLMVDVGARQSIGRGNKDDR